MRYQPPANYISDDVVQTPPEMAALLVQHFRPRGSILEPCRGEGNIYRELRRRRCGRIEWCEIEEDRNFFHWQKRANWIFTNPPWSQIRPFLQHSFSLAGDVMFLMTVNHAWTKARLKATQRAGFGIREILLVDTPATFPDSGFQLGAVHWSRGYQGPIKINQ